MELKSISKRIATEIRNSDQTQVEIARKINVHPSAITQYLNGRSQPALDTLAKLCIVLDVSADYILGIEEYSGKKKAQI